MAKAAPTKKETTEPAKVSPELFVGIKNKNATSTGVFNNPAAPGNIPFSQQMPGFGMPPFPEQMQGFPQAPMPPMAPGPLLGTPQMQGNISNSLRNMIYLGIETINSALAGSTQIMQGFAGTGYQTPYQQQHHHDWENDCYYSTSCCAHHHHNHGYNCCSHHHDNNCNCSSCCSTQDCNPSVHGC